jgi:putative transposase
LFNARSFRSRLVFFFSRTALHRKRLRTNNGLERLNKEIERRIWAAAPRTNDASLVRLVVAVIGEISDDW